MKCWLSREALNDMMAEGERKFPMETGGLLMGYWGEGVPVITHIIGPGPGASHERFNFEPDYAYHRQEVDRLYAEREGLWYLGDWHTHPCGVAEPSRLDLKMVQSVRANKDAHVPKPLMLILGGHLDRLGIYCLLPDGLKALDVETFSGAVVAA